jgi:predicted ATPase/DNA-binding winged helix-turn-helix (wHTH) protein
MKYEFPPYTLLPEQRQLLRDGAPIKLGGRAFDVLLALVDRRDRTVSKNELMDLVWPTVVVEENNLEVQIVTLRKLLGHPAIATVPGRGYRFAVPLATDISLELSQSSEVAAQGAEPRIAKSGYVPLPRPGSVLVGRLRDQEVVMSLLLRHRLVTLTGTGGIGKTRLAIEAARKQTTISDVAWADLSSATTPDRVPIVMATALDVAIEDASEAVARIITALQHRRAVLLVVDNAEHQIEATAAVVGALVAGAEGLSVLTTSREPLRIDGEVTYTLGGLEMPNENVPASEAHRFEAVSLFVDRLRAAGGRFRLDDDATADVVALCRMLNGMPLPIELAAARAPTLGLKRLRSVLRDNLVVLSSNRRDIPARQLTMRATLEWSYRLLNAAEQSAFRKAGVFAGGFTIDAFCAVAADEGADDWERVDLLESLVDKSLVTVNGEEPPRYALLETTRIYALEQLKQHDEWNRARQAHALYFTTYFAGEMDDAQRRHAEHFRRFFDDPNEAREETARPRVARADGSNAGRSAYGSLGDARGNWLSHYRSEWENLTTALEWADRTAAADLFGPLFNAAARIAPEAGDSVVVRRYVDTACAIAHDADPRTASELLTDLYVNT